MQEGIKYAHSHNYVLVTLNLPIAEEREDGLLGGLVAERPWPVLIRLVVLPLTKGNIPPLEICMTQKNISIHTCTCTCIILLSLYHGCKFWPIRLQHRRCVNLMYTSYRGV